MAEKKGVKLQNITHADIWYCEAGSKHMYIGLVKKGDSQLIVRVLADTLEDAWGKMAESGDVLIAESMHDIISEFVVDPHWVGM